MKISIQIVDKVIVSNTATNNSQIAAKSEVVTSSELKFSNQIGSNINNQALVNKPRKVKHAKSKAKALEPKISEKDCGCAIVKSFYAVPKKRLRKNYLRRWPKPPHIKRKKLKQAPKTTCHDGILLVAKLRDAFKKPPSPKKKNGGKKPVKLVKQKMNKNGMITKVTSSSSSTTKISGVLGEWSGRIFNLMNNWNRQLSNKKAKISHIKLGKRNKKTNKPKTKKKPLTDEQREKLKQNQFKTKVRRAEKLKCRKKIRKYLNVKFRSPYKGNKCEALGKIFRRCLKY